MLPVPHNLLDARIIRDDVRDVHVVRAPREVLSSDVVLHAVTHAVVDDLHDSTSVDGREASGIAVDGGIAVHRLLQLDRGKAEGLKLPRLEHGRHLRPQPHGANGFAARAARAFLHALYSPGATLLMYDQTGQLGYFLAVAAAITTGPA